jgi:hypothetical protein
MQEGATGMKRQILFRGKRTDAAHKWCYGNLQDRNGHFSIYEKTHFSDAPKGYYVGFAVYPETVGQFTGLMAADSTRYTPDGKKDLRIFEGDIIRLGKSPILGKPIIGKIIWNDCGFWYEYKNPVHEGVGILGMMIVTGKEIIGNIFDTPELLDRE